ncbi:hypothetical protein GCK72_006197 [Caenorhabditis remanei]|uniref:Uncharacterized protein n=1 Tax=Caenorhabditis remanei TaxID=31234 RepID=A0A6A5HGT9_CAERE|nr:hypothetical protein GCK72_006197 [Caenorhabditis remanei]KAF1766241.1 hypothetical protein GCK72_006197 [Caenorhabditis remanei]
MSVPAAFLILLWSSIAGSLPLAPAPPDFNADFSKRDIQSDLMPIVGEDELQNLRHNGFQEQLHHLRQQNIGRNSATITDEMARIRNSIEDISEFSVDSNEIDEAINDITVPTDVKLKKSSKFAELSEIHNADSSNKGLPPFAFSEDQEESESDVEKVEVVPPTTTIVLATLPTTTVSTTTRTTTTPPTTFITTTQKYVHIDSDVSVPRRTQIAISSTPMVDRTVTTSHVPIEISTTTLAPIASTTPSTTEYSPPPTTRSYIAWNTQSPHIFSSSTVRLPSAIPLATSTTFASRLPEIIMTTPRPYRGGPFTTEFTIEPIQKRSEGRTSLRDRIRSTSQLLNLLGDKISGIDQKAVSTGVEPKTGVLTNIYDRGEIKHRNYRTKQWGISGEGRQGVQTYDGQFSGVAYGATKQKGGGYIMRKKMGKRPWSSRGYKTRRLGERRPEYTRPSTFVEKKTTEVAVEPYGSKRRGEWIRGVKVSERRNAVRKVSESQKSFAQALLESEEASMKQLKKTLRQIREVVKIKTSSSTTSTVTTTPRPIKKKNRIDSEFFNGPFDLRRV